MLGLAVMGYHPGIEDDGVYLTAVKYKLNPALYPHDSAFFRFQMQASFFDNWVAGFVRWTGIPLAYTELLWQFASIALIVFGCWTIARRLFPEARAQWAGGALVTAMFTLPVAGTALYLVDQHLHPRTVATGLILLAVSRILAGRRWQAVPFLLLAFVLHPIMAAFGISFCFFLTMALLEPFHLWLRRWRGTGGVSWAAAFIPLGWFFDPPQYRRRATASAPKIPCAAASAAARLLFRNRRKAWRACSGVPDPPPPQSPASISNRRYSTRGSQTKRRPPRKAARRRWCSESDRWPSSRALP